MTAGKSAPRERALQSLEELQAAINKDYGKGTLMRLGDTPMEVPGTFSSGSIGLDEALGIGGIPRGRIIEIYGPESSGKTSIALHATGNAQRKGLSAAFIDAEHALDPSWAEALGVKTEDLYVSQPDSGEEALQVTARLVNSGLFGIITVDSVAALVPKAELEGAIGDSHIGLMARMMSQGLRMLTGPAAETGTTIIFINQLREKVGVFFGSSETQPGGKALKFYSTIRLDVRRIATIKSGEQATGSRVKVKVVKNKLSPPFRAAEFDFYFGIGISREAELLDLAVDRGVIRKSGAHYRLPGEDKAVQGKDKACSWLAEHPEEMAAVEAAVRAAPAPAKFGKAAAGEGISMEGPAPWDEGGEASE